MFNKIFKKDAALGDGDVKTILGRLGKLSSEEKIAKGEELKTLAVTHTDAAVRVASVELLGDFDSLSLLLNHDCTETSRCAAARIAQDTSFRERLAKSPNLLEIPQVRYSMLQYAVTLEQAKAYAKPFRQLAGLNLVSLCLDCVSDDVRQWLTAQMRDLRQLQALEKASRNRNKNTNRLAREQIAILKGARDQLDDREQECDRLQTTVQSILDNEIENPAAGEPQKAHLLSARLNTLRKSNHALLADNQGALEASPTDESHATRLAQLQIKLESTEKLLEQAAHTLQEQIVEQAKKQALQKERETAAAELQHVLDINTGPESDSNTPTTTKPIAKEKQLAQSLRDRMQQQELKNETIKKQLASGNPRPDIYQLLWRAQSSCLKLSKQALSFAGKHKNISSADNTEELEQIAQLNTNMNNFVEHGNTIKKTLVAQFTRSLEKLDGLLSDGNMTSAAGLHADCRNKSRLLPQHTNKTLLTQFNNINKRYDELKDWRNFAATPKQVALCEAVEHLADNAEEPETQAELLKTLRKSWQELGRANRTLNKRFDAAASTGFCTLPELF